MDDVKDLQIFDFEDRNVRVVMMDGEPWFVARDVAAALGYPDSSLDQVNNLFGHIPVEWKGLNPIMVNLKDGREQVREMLCLSEQGVYFFLARSDKSKALPFQKKIAGEIIPSIRRHGVYMTPEMIERTLMNPDFIIGLATKLKDEQTKNKELEGEVKALSSVIDENRPKILFADSVEASKTSILVGELATLIKQNGVDMGQNRLFAWLRDNGFLMKQGSWKNMPTQRSLDAGLFEVRESTRWHPDGTIRIDKTPKLTGRGQVYFVNLFLHDQKEAQRESTATEAVLS